jgi:hypothetical protein
MAFEQINRGTTANDGTGDNIREAFRKVNDNFDKTLEEVTTAGVERAYIINADGSQGTKATSDFGGSNSLKPFDMIKVNNGINGVVNYGSGAVSLLSSSYSFGNSLIKGISFTDILSSTSTAGSFSTLNYLNYSSIAFPFQIFKTYFAIGNTSLITDSRSFCGFVSSGFTINNINPSVAAQIAITNDSSENNLQIAYNQIGIGVTKIDLGSDFPARYVKGERLYKVQFEFKSTTSCEVKIKDLISGNSRTELVTEIVLTQNVVNTFSMSLNSNTTASATRLLFNHLIVQDNYDF